MNPERMIPCLDTTFFGKFDESFNSLIKSGFGSLYFLYARLMVKLLSLSFDIVFFPGLRYFFKGEW
jgi:hypothetical protein